MTGAFALSLLAAVVIGVTGLPIDPFLPLAAALALAPGWPAPARLVAVVALGPLAALITADVVIERTALYALVAFLATRAEWELRDGVLARVLLVAGALVALVGARALLALLDAMPAPGESLTAVLATVAWTAVHAGVVLGMGALWRRVVRGGAR